MASMVMTHKDYEAAVAALKAGYSKHKTYSVQRGCGGWMATDVVKAHALAESKGKGGWVQCTASIGYSWCVYEAGDKAVMLYMDGGMGWDTVMLMGKDKAALEELRQTGIALGLVRLRK